MIYFLYGPNRYAIKTELHHLKAAFEQKFGTAGIEKKSGDDIAPGQLGEILQGASLFSAERLIILDNPGQQKALWEALLDWLPKVPDEVQLVIIEEQPDKRTKTFKELNKVARVIEAKELDEPSTRKWAQTYTQKHKATISPSDIAFLIERVGLDQTRLASELDKLFLHQQIDRELITELTEPTPQTTAFELLDAVLGRQGSRAQQILTELRGSEDPYRLFGLFASQIHALALVVAAGPHISSQQIAKEGGLHPFVVSKISRSAKGTSWQDVKEIIAITAELDDQLKGSSADPWLLLETALMRIATIRLL